MQPEEMRVIRSGSPTTCASAAAEGAPHRKAIKSPRSCAPKAVGPLCQQAIRTTGARN